MSSFRHLRKSLKPDDQWRQAGGAAQPESGRSLRSLILQGILHHTLMVISVDVQKSQTTS